jgi:hypothetical protein
MFFLQHYHAVTLTKNSYTGRTKYCRAERVS